MSSTSLALPSHSRSKTETQQSKSLLKLFDNGDVVEIFCPEIVGKSFIFADVISDCIMPTAHSGKGRKVMYLDLTCQFDIFQVATALENKTKATEEDIKLWLANLSVAKCGSYEQLLITIHSIEPLIANSKVPFSLVVLDSISSFYWLNTKDRDYYMIKIVEALESLKNRYNLTVIACTQQLVAKRAKNQATTGAKALYKPYLCQQWQKLVGQRYVLSRKDLFSKLEFTLAQIHPEESSLSFTALNSGGISFLS